MSITFTRRLIAGTAGLAAAATLAMASPATALTTTSQRTTTTSSRTVVKPQATALDTSPYGSAPGTDDEYCQQQANIANDLLTKAKSADAEGNVKLASALAKTADTVAGLANAEGDCTLVQIS